MRSYKKKHHPKKMTAAIGQAEKPFDDSVLHFEQLGLLVMVVWAMVRKPTDRFISVRWFSMLITHRSHRGRGRKVRSVYSGVSEKMGSVYMAAQANQMYAFLRDHGYIRLSDVLAIRGGNWPYEVTAKFEELRKLYPEFRERFPEEVHWLYSAFVWLEAYEPRR